MAMRRNALQNGCFDAAACAAIGIARIGLHASRQQHTIGLRVIENGITLF
jgi:hypothetical protein